MYSKLSSKLNNDKWETLVKEIEDSLFTMSIKDVSALFKR
jgi:hypothetical protein